MSPQEIQFITRTVIEQTTEVCAQMAERMAAGFASNSLPGVTPSEALQAFAETIRRTNARQFGVADQ